MGFKIPGRKKRVIATLFADDTTIYLSKEDDFGQLTEILNTWHLEPSSTLIKQKLYQLGTKITETF